MTFEEFNTSTLSNKELAIVLGTRDRIVRGIRAVICKYNEEVGLGTLTPKTIAKYNDCMSTYFSPSPVSTSFQYNRGRPPKTITYKRDTFILDSMLKKVLNRDELAILLRKNSAIIGTKAAKSDIKRKGSANPRNKEFACDPSTAIDYIKTSAFKELKSALDDKKGKKERLISVHDVTIMDTIDGERTLDLKGRSGSFYLIVANLNLTNYATNHINKFFKLYDAKVCIVDAIKEFYDELLEKKYVIMIQYTLMDGKRCRLAKDKVFVSPNPIKDNQAFKNKKSKYDIRVAALAQELERLKKYKRS